jgi:hypothetical protein
MNDSRIYAIPVLGRYGLTHGILAWARCCLWCEQNGVTMLAPFWLKLRIGPYLRRERDKRNYFLLFNCGRAVAGLRRLATLIRAAKIDVRSEWPEVPTPRSRPVVLRFHNSLQRNAQKSFSQVLGHGPFLRRELLAMTRRRYHPPTPSESFVAIHVRMGDFSPAASDGSIITGVTNTRLAIDWYCDRLDALRRGLGMPVRAIVFSDGSDSDLAPLLGRERVSRAPRQQSVTDLLQMGLGVALIASGSGFSLWGAFLGSTPRIAHPGQSIVPIDVDATRDIESPFGSEIDETFLAHVRARMST